MREQKETHIIVILRLLVLHEKLQAFLPDYGLDVPTSPMSLLHIWVLGLRLAFVLGVIWLADHLGLAMRPDGRHTGFGVADVTDLVCEVWVGLTIGINNGQAFTTGTRSF